MKAAAPTNPRSGRLIDGALGFAMPTPEAGLLLKACLHKGETAGESWCQWCARAVDPKRALKAAGEPHKRLLPHLYVSLQRNGIAAGGDLMATLKAARLWEERRAGRVLDICREAVDRLAAEHIPVVLLRGVPNTRFYERPWMRHCGAVNLQLPQNCLPEAEKVLKRIGFRAINGAGSAMPEVEQMRHESGLTLNLYRRPFPAPYAVEGHSHVQQRTEPWRNDTETWRVLNKADTLLHLCCHLFFGTGSKTFDWVLDAYTILAACSGNDLALLETAARKNHMETALSCMTGWLSNMLDAPVPEAFLEALRTSPTRSSHENKKSALCAACHLVRLKPARALRAFGGWPLPLFGLHACIWPPRDYLRWAYTSHEHVSLAAGYLGVPIRYLRRRLAGGAGR